MKRLWRILLFLLFFLSGFSGLLYQVVWTRLAFASFGIITPVLSVVLSVFMLGLAVGSWWGGRYISWLVSKSGLSAAYFYGAAEFLIGLGAFAAPKMFQGSQSILLPTGEMNSAGYLLLSAIAIAISIFPWCFCMGTTFPFMMAYVREREQDNTSSFSFLYLANVLGAMCGTALTAVVLVETLGFHRTLWVAAAANFAIALVSIVLGLRSRQATTAQPTPQIVPDASGSSQASSDRGVWSILFFTGFSSMAMEVVWSRAFTPVLKTQVYSFAMILFAYLGATFLGSLIYRWDLARNRVRSVSALMAVLAIAPFIPVFVNDPRIADLHTLSYDISLKGALLLLASISPLCAALGYLTPSLIDRYAAGQPRRAGQAYAINVLGCILGPLVGGYLLLPFMNERWALVLLGLPFVAYCLIHPVSHSRIPRRIFELALTAVLVWAFVLSDDYEQLYLDSDPHAVVQRDYAASVISFGRGMGKILFVNGIGMTKLTPITKFMAHLPLALHVGPPKSALVICFGMGTTYRSALAWNIDTTAVELVPSVVEQFGYYHSDAEECMANPKGHVIIDDGRRFLKRCGRSFDVIVVDPPPPVEAAGSSLLFSTEFYSLAKQHLNKNGIVQMWYPGSGMPTTRAVLRSFSRSFPYMRCYISMEGWGAHLLGSMEPIPDLNARQLSARMPQGARGDLLEWAKPDCDAASYIGRVIPREFAIGTYFNADPNPQAVVTDDRPFNEYFLLRRMR
jgi:spermidine synthase